VKIARDISHPRSGNVCRRCRCREVADIMLSWRVAGSERCSKHYTVVQSCLQQTIIFIKKGSIFPPSLKPQYFAVEELER
jgi:hypothetical protein